MDQTVLDVDAPRMGAGEVAHEFLECRRPLEGIFGKYRQQFLGFGFQPTECELFCVFLGLSCVDKLPGHQSSSSSHSSTELGMPSRMDSRIPGTESRNNVS